MLKPHPIVHLIPFSTTLWKTDLVILIILLCNILQNTPAFKQSDALAVGKGIRQRWNSPVWVDGEEPWLLLHVGADVDMLGLVGEVELFERNGDFDAVGCGVGVEFDVGFG